MKRLTTGLLALTLVAGYVLPARADAISLLSLNGTPDFLEDENFESIVPAGSPTTGSVFVGMFTLSSIDGHSTALEGSSFSGVLVAEVTNVSGSTVTFGPVSNATYAGLQAGGFSNLPARADANSAVIVFDDSSGFPFVDATSGSNENDALLTATDGTKVFEFGFSGTTSAQATLGGGFAGTGFSFVLALNQTFNGTGLNLTPVTSAQSGIPGLPAADLHGSGATAPGNPGNFTFRTDSDFFINPTAPTTGVPEPASVMVFGIVALTLCSAGYGRRRRAAKKLAA